MSAPNVVVVCCDQLRAFEVGCYGNDVVRTPNLDRFAAGGVRFETAVSNNPVCLPARACLLSGQYSRTSCRWLDWGDWWKRWPSGRGWFPDPTVAEILRDNGYDTALVGKWHIDADPLGVGFDYAIHPSLFKAHRHYGETYKENEGEPFVVDGFGPEFEIQALERYLHGRDGSRPLFLYLNILPPHMPLGPGNLPPRYDGMYSRDEIPLRENVWADGKMAHDEWWFKVYMIWDYFYREAMAPAPARDTDRLPEGFDLRDLAAAYYASTTCTDDLFGSALAVLEKAGITDNAVVVFTSDHGENLGSHQVFNKERLWEESIRIPMLVRAPGIEPRVDTTHIAQLIDIAPTVLDLCGIDVPGHIQGRSLAPALRGEAVPGADEAFIETPMRQVGLRTSRYVVGIELAEDLTTIADKHHFAYDLEADPLQLDNLANDRSQQEWQEPLRRRVIEWHETTPAMQPGEGLTIARVPT